jgi:uncharacterized protein YlaI
MRGCSVNGALPLPPPVTLEVACPFCGAARLHDINSRARGRDQIVGKFKCSTCDSRFAVQLKTLRRAKGGRFRAMEPAQEAETAKRISEATAKNDEIARQLLADPRCTCGSEDQLRSAKVYGWRDDGLVPGGHTRGLPSPPRHRADCPARNGGSR